ncbi:hypothetical protein [Rubritalea tangerina]|uniref:hypothetical protein n=1 Tax=Rubritalea tangerina TaxID=430798 RepID=UPI0036198E47
MSMVVLLNRRSYQYQITTRSNTSTFLAGTHIPVDTPPKSITSPFSISKKVSMAL